jgi:hypothetical protein
MTILELYLLFVAGILLSVLVPIGAKWIKESRSSLDDKEGTPFGRALAVAGPYIRVAAGSAIVGLVLVLIFLASGTKIQDIAWYNAMLYGYGWDSTLQKVSQS